MLNIESVNHVGIRISDKGSSIDFYETLGFGNMSAIFIRDPDRNVIELDAYSDAEAGDPDGHAHHP